MFQKAIFMSQPVKDHFIFQMDERQSVDLNHDQQCRVGRAAMRRFRSRIIKEMMERQFLQSIKWHSPDGIEHLLVDSMGQQWAIASRRRQTPVRL